MLRSAKLQSRVNLRGESEKEMLEREQTIAEGAISSKPECIEFAVRFMNYFYIFVSLKNLEKHAFFISLNIPYIFVYVDCKLKYGIFVFFLKYKIMRLS